MSAEIFANPKFAANLLSRVPMRPFGRPEDFMGIVSYLMSEHSSYHTGQSMIIDGGYSLY
jgi:NAD(P)-dependent dehydrogenase (short-subunit alcohol dehydrogenase family)